MRRTAWAPLLALLLVALAPLATSADEEPAPGPCPRTLEGRANGDGSVTVDWSPVSGATSYTVHRAATDGPFVERGRVMAPVTSFRDGATEAGATYRYVVLRDGAAAGPEACEAVSATSVPYVPGLLRALGVSGVCVLAYAVVAGTRPAPVSLGRGTKPRAAGGPE